MKFHWQLDPQLSGAIAKAIRPLAPGNAACAGVAGGPIAQIAMAATQTASRRWWE